MRILTSGPLPLNSGEVVASRRPAAAQTAVPHLDVDYVLVDAPPLLGFGDVGALAPAVDGLLVAANVKESHRPILEQGREAIKGLPCRKVGVIVTGEKMVDSRYAAYSVG